MWKRINDRLSGLPMTLMAGGFLLLSFALPRVGAPWGAYLAWVAVLVCGVPLLYLAVRVIAHYRSYRTGSRADYTMKRLPDGREYHRRALALPLFGLAGLALVYLVFFGINLAIYYLMTPGWMNPRLF